MVFNESKQARPPALPGLFSTLERWCRYRARKQVAAS